MKKFLTSVIIPCVPLLYAVDLQAQAGRTVQGEVRNADGEALSGVTVTSSVNGQSTSTDKSGRFSIAGTDDAILTFKLIGYKTHTERISSKGSLQIVLESDLQQIDEVVVIGYGTKKTQDVGGAVISVDKKLLTGRPVTNTLSALQGAAPGLVITRTNGQPGREGWNAQIRGITTLGTQNSPLFIIDGVEGSINALNPEDIADLTVLQDAASAAIYGAKAGGGVIVITTKSGQANQNTRFNVSSMYTVRTPYARPENLSSREEAVLQNAANVNGGGSPAFSDEQLGWFDDPNIDYVWLNNSWNYFYNNNMQEILMRKQSPQKSINLQASGGGDKSSYLFSMGYLDQRGVFKFGPDKYSRFNARINYNTKFSKVFSLDSRISFVKENFLSPPQDVEGGGLMYGIYTIRAARNPIFAPGTTDRYAFINTISSAYPILKDGGYKDEDRYNINGVFSLSAKQLLKGLDLKFVYSPGLVLSDQVVFNRTVQRWTIDKDLVLSNQPNFNLNQVNSLNKVRPYTLTQNFFSTADYDYKVDKHNFHLLAGFEYKIYQFDEVQAMQRALLLNNFPTLNYTTLTTADVSNVKDNIQVNAWQSYFGRLNYNFDHKYYFEGVVRRDGSSRLAPGYRYQTFYSGNAFWRVTQENWFKNSLPWINEFKIGASYGTAGGAQTSKPNDNNYDFQSPLLRDYYPFNDSRTSTFRQDRLPSESKAWEIIKTANFSTDIAFLKNKLRFHFDYFIKKNDNVFIAQQLPTMLGISPNAANLAAIEVKGWGLTLNWSDQFKNGSYFVAANLSDDKNKVVRYNGSTLYTTGINNSLPGLPTNSIFGYKADGYFNTAEELSGYPVRVKNTAVGDIRLLDLNNDGVINQGVNTSANHGDLTYLGSTNSRYVFGLSAGINWKGFDLSVLFNGVGKRNILIDPEYAMAFYNSWVMPWKIHEDYWTPENTDAKFPRIFIGDRINDQVSSHWVQNAAYIRLKNVQLGYTLTKGIHKIKHLGDIKIYFSGQDLWEKTGMWFNYYDPENNDKISIGYPLWRSYAFGLNFSF